MELSKRIQIISRKKLVNNTGWFLKTMTGSEENLPATFGECYVSSGLPGQSRAGHYHNLATEWFTLLEGTCILTLVDIETGERKAIQMDADQPETIVVPPKIAHLFANNGSRTFILSVYSSERFDPADTILFNFAQ
jgi:dTDP-4-dehydrorhamnose 3,5-epimerase-like enzyme